MLLSFQNKQCSPCQIPRLPRDPVCWSGTGGAAHWDRLLINTSNEETQTQKEMHTTHLGCWEILPLWSCHHSPLLARIYAN